MGFFITFEGTEGAGKTSQVKLLKKYLSKRGFKVIISREPGGTKIGEKIRNILSDKGNKNMSAMTEFLLFSAARAQHIEELISPALKEEKIVISDRFYDASFAYQGYGRRLELKLIDYLTSKVAGPIKPNITFFLDIKPKNARGRLKKRPHALDRIEKENLNFFLRVRNGYCRLHKKFPNRIKIINADGKIEEIHKKIIQEVEKKLAEGKLHD